MGHALLGIQAEQGALCAPGRGLGGDDIQVADRAGPVLVFGDVQGFAGCLDGLLLAGNLFAQPMQVGQIVFDFLKGRQHTLPVLGQGCVIGCCGCVLPGVAGTTIEQCQGQARAE